MDGIINIFKPKGITSHDVVNKIRRILKIKRVGHTGTLDPNATGVLPLCIGKATRVSEYLLDLDKEYIGELCLGLATDTQDKWGKVLNRSSKRVTETEICNVFNQFKGKIKQVPPMHSAVRYKGKKLYEIAREGKVVERKSRDIYIYDLNILNIIDNKKIIFYTKCSRGTYIRTLCDDIGEALGTYGYMSYLVRVGVGDFKISNSYSLDYIESLDKEKLKSIIYPMDEGLHHLDSIIIDKKLYKRLINGATIYIENQSSENYKEGIPLKVYCNDNFIGIGQVFQENEIPYLKMSKVLI